MPPSPTPRFLCPSLEVRRGDGGTMPSRSGSPCSPTRSKRSLEDTWAFGCCRTPPSRVRRHRFYGTCIACANWPGGYHASTLLQAFECVCRRSSGGEYTLHVGTFGINIRPKIEGIGFLSRSVYPSFKYCRISAPFLIPVLRFSGGRGIKNGANPYYIGIGVIFYTSQ
jgi:hypothetical protein